jgi:hypothetical protein
MCMAFQVGSKKGVTGAFGVECQGDRENNAAGRPSISKLRDLRHF